MYFQYLIPAVIILAVVGTMIYLISTNKKSPQAAKNDKTKNGQVQSYPLEDLLLAYQGSADQSSSVLMDNTPTVYGSAAEMYPHSDLVPLNYYVTRNARPWYESGGNYWNPIQRGSAQF